LRVAVIPKPTDVREITHTLLEKFSVANMLSHLRNSEPS
jgi:hypothetical protein